MSRLDLQTSLSVSGTGCFILCPHAFSALTYGLETSRLRSGTPLAPNTVNSAWGASNSSG